MMNREYELKSARFIAADCLRRFLLPGDTAIDATMGNGHDTLMLCELVGENGCVHAFDVQEQAVENTRERLENSNVLQRAHLHLDGHQNMKKYVNTPVQAVMFNLGWLPGGDKTVTTRWDTTKKAVEAALQLLEINGICIICVYPGHPAGDHERECLTQQLSSVRPQDFNIVHHCFINAGPGAPECYILQKQPSCRAEFSF